MAIINLEKDFSMFIVLFLEVVMVLLMVTLTSYNAKCPVTLPAVS
jgi:hypothetical protein